MDIATRIEELLAASKMSKFRASTRLRQSRNSVGEVLANLRSGGGIKERKLGKLAELFGVEPVILYLNKSPIPRDPVVHAGEYFLSVIGEYMAQNDISISDLARRSGVDQPTISAAFGSKTGYPKTDTMIKLAEALGLGVEFLVDPNRLTTDISDGAFGLALKASRLAFEIPQITSGGTYSSHLGPIDRGLLASLRHGDYGNRF